jgi:hypothetical protein
MMKLTTGKSVLHLVALYTSTSGPDSLGCWHRGQNAMKLAHIQRRLPLVCPVLPMLMDTLMHRCLFFQVSKNLYEKKDSAQDRHAFAEVVIADHNRQGLLTTLQSAGRTTSPFGPFRVSHGMPMAYRMCLVPDGRTPPAAT